VLYDFSCQVSLLNWIVYSYLLSLVYCCWLIVCSNIRVRLELKV